MANLTVEITGALTAPTGTNVTREGVRNYTFTITRTNFTGDVTLAATGLPTGVTASFPDAGGNVLSGATLSCTVRLTAATDAPLVSSDAWSIEASGTGIATETASSVVSVLAIGAAAPFFEETFADGQLNPADGFTWVRVDEGGTASLQNNLDNQSGSTQIRATGDSGAVVKAGFTHALHGIYQGKVAGEDNALPEFNFGLGRDVKEVWFEWELWIPSNFTIRGGESPSNNKFWDVIGATYSSGDGPAFLWEMVRGTDGDGTAMSRILARRASNPGALPELVQGERLEFIGDGASYPAKRGQWNTIRSHIKLPSEWNVVSDGRWRIWINGTLFRDFDGYDFGGRSNAGGSELKNIIRQGYLHGYANTGYTDDTVFSTQLFKVYDSNPGW
jgi:hypothetical protein